MDFSPTDQNRNGESDDEYPRFDPETIERIKYALEGTIDADVSVLSPEDDLYDFLHS